MHILLQVEAGRIACAVSGFFLIFSSMCTICQHREFQLQGVKIRVLIDANYQNLSITKTLIRFSMESTTFFRYEKITIRFKFKVTKTRSACAMVKKLKTNNPNGSTRSPPKDHISKARNLCGVKIAPGGIRQVLNSTPIYLFTHNFLPSSHNHAEELSRAEKWMRGHRREC